MTDKPAFRHEPLDDPSTQIRLVHIPLLEGPLIDGQYLQCTIRTFSFATWNLNSLAKTKANSLANTKTNSLDEMKRGCFTAVSYAWGSGAKSRTVYINGSPFNVSDNLWWFVYHISFREHGPTSHSITGIDKGHEKIIRWFWIDQICINQSRSTERNHQVKMMSEIYANAERVLVWLGRPISLDARQDDPGRDVDDIAKQKLRFYGDEIVECEYWSRLWVIQEIMLGKQVHVLYGSLAWKWSHIRSLFRERRDPEIPAIVTRKAIPSLMTNKYALHRALELFGHYECSDPRDKVYGLMGIVHKKERIEIDYEKTAAQVYWDAIAAFNPKWGILKEPDRIRHLGHAMGVTGRTRQREAVGGLALENFQSLFNGRHPELVFEP